MPLSSTLNMWQNKEPSLDLIYTISVDDNEKWYTGAKLSVYSTMKQMNDHKDLIHVHYYSSLVGI